jgi:Trm5-related predicted tRNA methylase
LKRSMPSQGTVYASRIRLMRSILGLPRRINV